jgi:hypothetical protein
MSFGAATAPGDAHALLLAAREFVGIRVAVARAAFACVEEHLDPLLQFGALRLARKQHRLSDASPIGEPGIQG